MMADHEIKLNICYGCMRKLEEGQKICPFCGYDFSASQNGADRIAAVARLRRESDTAGHTAEKVAQSPGIRAVSRHWAFRPLSVTADSTRENQRHPASTVGAYTS